MKKKFKYLFWKFFKKIGLEVLPDEKKNSLQSYLFDLLKKNKFEFVIDVGSNIGQFYNLIRNIGYKGRIELFEPLLECQNLLIKITETDKNTKLNSFALGEKNEIINFYITKNNVSSSLLLPKDSSKVSKSYDVIVKKFDDLDLNLKKYSGVLLKIDAQGYEKHVILGSVNNLKYINYILMELSLSAQYVGEVEMTSMFQFMKELGYIPIFIYPGITNKDNEVLQYEVIFKKS
jgi:FkbM family methyltransferase